METSDKMGLGDKTEAVTYIFGSGQDKKMIGEAASGLRRTRYRQIVAAVVASFSGIPFGLMLGWPSPTNPILLQPDSVIPISIDQSAMIAGFLMIGNALGTPFSKKCFLESKFGILLGVAFATIGWFLMWQARDIFWLLASRLLVGVGNGYGSGQLKVYLDELCDVDLKPALAKQTNLHVLAAVVAVFSFGPFLDFRLTALVCLLATIAAFFLLLLLLPSTPAALVKAGRFKRAGELVSKLRPWSDMADEVKRIATRSETAGEDLGVWAALSDGDTRKRFLAFAFLVFCQQWSGAPATIVYAQILFERADCPHAAYLALAYAVVFFFASALGAYISPRYDKRKVLLVSASGVVLLTTAEVCVAWLRLGETWRYASVPVIYSFIVLHTVGLGSVPVTLVADFFAKEYRTCVTHFFVMFHSVLALVVTKIFQVLVSRYDVGAAFCLFLAVSVVGFVFIFFGLPKSEPTLSIGVFVKSRTK